MWAKPPSTIAGDPSKTHLDPGRVTCTKCKISTKVDEKDRKAGFVKCSNPKCCAIIKVAKK